MSQRGFLHMDGLGIRGGGWGAICMYVLSRACCTRGWVCVCIWQCHSDAPRQPPKPAPPPAADCYMIKWLSEIESHLSCDTPLSREDRHKKKRYWGKIATDRERRWGGCGWRIKRTPEITKAFERQVQYRGRRRDFFAGGGREEATQGGMLEMKEEDLTEWQDEGRDRVLDSYLFS